MMTNDEFRNSLTRIIYEINRREEACKFVEKELEVLADYMPKKKKLSRPKKSKINNDFDFQ
jgi:uncharacterized protein YqeY